MNFRQELPAIVYLVDQFRHSPDWVTTFLELSPIDQGFIASVLVSAALGLWKLWSRFRSKK